MDPLGGSRTAGPGQPRAHPGRARRPSDRSERGTERRAERELKNKSLSLPRTLHGEGGHSEVTITLRPRLALTGPNPPLMVQRGLLTQPRRPPSLGLAAATGERERGLSMVKELPPTFTPHPTPHAATGLPSAHTLKNANQSPTHKYALK